MPMYTTSGLTVATAATDNHAVAELFNNATAYRLHVHEIHCFITAATLCYPVIRRTSTKGTPASTVTSTIVNDHEHALSPASTATLELANFSVQPTLIANDLHTAVFPASIGSGAMWVFNTPLEVAAGQGIAITTRTAIAFPASRVTFVWSE